MPNQSFQADNPYLRINLPLSALCNISALSAEKPIPPELAPLLIGVESQRKQGAPADAPQAATRYCLVFPGSGFLRIAVKVEESAPSITTETIEQHGGIVRVKIEGFSSGVFKTTAGETMPFFKAEKITPILTDG